MKNYYVVKEYDCFVRGTDWLDTPSNYIPMPEKTFDALEYFILSTNNDTDTDAIELMSITSRRGFGKVICIKNHVGLIEMKDGTKIEILPKLYRKEKSNSEKITRAVFLNMLKSFRQFPFKKFNYSSLGVMKNSLYEIFIEMFIQEVRQLTKKGLKSDYIQHEGNENYYKGKLMFSNHIKKNIVHKERFYVSYDIFSNNRPENKLIKATLKKLYKQKSDYRNKRDMEHLLVLFDMVDESTNYQRDFDRVKINRSMSGYDIVLKWCRLFLSNKSFTTFTGSEVSYALLFPMEKVFESYIASMLKRHYSGSFTIRTQDRSYHLFDEPKKFLLRPDIVIELEDSETIIIDTKWKILNSNPRENYGISQSDMYQMYAYSKKYHAKRIILLYPYNERLNWDGEKGPSFSSLDGVTVDIAFVDLEHTKESIDEMIQKMME